MKKTILTALILLLFTGTHFAQLADSTQLKLDELEKTFTYQTGNIELESGHARLKVPAGFRYLDKIQSINVLTNIWGNPADSTVLGMLVPAGSGVLAPGSWAFILSYEEMGYVKDDDAEDIDYDELLTELKKETKESNALRVSQGYEPIDFVGWASKPFYDNDKKILHWAKEVKFGTDSVNTLNYNLRVLGRKGVFVMNAVASMSELKEVESNIDKVIGCVEYKDGNKYTDFDSDVDNVAAWTIGGLVAGKILAKVGLFAVFIKFWKLIALAIAGAGGAIWKFIKGRRNNNGDLKEIGDVE